MTSKLFWLGSALCGALLVNGCSSSGSTDGGTTTTASGTTTGGNTGTTTGTTTGTHTSTGTSTTTTGTSTGTGTTTSTGTTTGTSTGTTTGTTTGGTMVGTPCDPTMTDTICAPAGYFCLGVNLSDGGVAGSCVIPGDQNACTDAVGCSAGFFCVANVFAAGTTCVQGCTQTADCNDPLKGCVPQLISASQAGCFFNTCGPGSNTGDGGSINGTDFYSTCNGDATSDGTCVPFATASGAAGLCQQSGPIALNQPCSNTRGDAGVGLCEVDNVCAILNINSGGVFAEFSACLPLCTVGAPTAPDGGPGCDSTAICEKLFQGEPFGACFETCVLASPNCPTPLVCLNIGDPNNGICGPG